MKNNDFEYTELNFKGRCFYFLNFISMLGVVEALKNRDIDVGVSKGGAVGKELPLVSVLGEMAVYFKKSGKELFGEYPIGDKLSWLQVYWMGLEVFAKGKLPEFVPEDIRSMIVEGIIQDQGGVKTSGTFYKFVKENADISFRKIADTVFGDGFSEYLAKISKLGSTSLVAERLLRHVKKINEGEIKDVGNVLAELFSVFVEIEKDNKGVFNNLVKE